MSLEIRKLNKEFGGIRAVQDLDFVLQKGKITALIGPNGAGKTTVFNLITGFLRPTDGLICWKKREISCSPPYLIAQQGISRTFQEIKLFRSLTVGENLLMAKRRGTHESLLASLVRTKAIKSMTSTFLKGISESLQTLNLTDKIDVSASALSYGQSKIVEILRAAIAEPDLLLLDEPVAGLNPVMITCIKKYMTFLVRERGISILFIEHNIPFVFEVADWIVVIDHGVKIAEGTPAEIRNDSRVIEAYLG